MLIASYVNFLLEFRASCNKTKIVVTLWLYVVGLCRFASLVFPLFFSERRIVKDTEETFVFLDRLLLFIIYYYFTEETFVFLDRLLLFIIYYYFTEETFVFLDRLLIACHLLQVMYFSSLLQKWRDIDF